MIEEPLFSDIYLE